ncbi:MAG: type IV pilin N-terminal domain-containing protein [Haloarculaceae archaeon]
MGIGLAVALVASVGVLLLAATSVSTRQPDVPDTDWSLDRVNDTHVRLTHTGGDPVPGTDLVVTVDGYERAARWPPRVVRGDAVLVRATDGRRVRLYWDGDDRADRRLLARWRVGATATP